MVTNLFENIANQLIANKIIKPEEKEPLRSFAGGYHTKTQVRCFLFSMTLTIIALLGIKFIPQNNFIIMSLAIISSIIILLLAPIEDNNKPIVQIEIAIYKMRTRNILIVEVNG